MMTQHTSRGTHHTCDYEWCQASCTSAIEHWGDGEISVSHDGEIKKIECYALVTVDGSIYEDEINLCVDGEDYCLNGALTVVEATQLRDLLDTAIANRAEVRGG